MNNDMLQKELELKVQQGVNKIMSDRLDALKDREADLHSEKLLLLGQIEAYKNIIEKLWTDILKKSDRDDY